MIGTDGLDRARSQRRPERALIAPLPQRRGEDVSSSGVEILALVDSLVEQKVLGAGLAKSRLPTGLRPPQGIHRPGTGYMHADAVDHLRRAHDLEHRMRLAVRAQAHRDAFFDERHHVRPEAKDGVRFRIVGHFGVVFLEDGQVL